MDHPDRAARHDHPDRPDAPPPAADRPRPDHPHRPHSDTPDARPLAMGDTSSSPRSSASAPCPRSPETRPRPRRRSTRPRPRPAQNTPTAPPRRPQLAHPHQREPIRHRQPGSTPPSHSRRPISRQLHQHQHSERWIEAKRSASLPSCLRLVCGRGRRRCRGPSWLC